MGPVASRDIGMSKAEVSYRCSNGAEMYEVKYRTSDDSSDEVTN